MTEALLTPTMPTVTVEALRARCSTCSMHQLCLPMGLDVGDMDRLDQIIGRRRKIVRGASLFRIGDSFQNLYAIRLGHFKTYQINPGGEEQVTGFQMAGELLAWTPSALIATTVMRWRWKTAKCVKFLFPAWNNCWAICRPCCAISTA